MYVYMPLRKTKTGHFIIIIYIYMYVYIPLRKTKTGHIRILIYFHPVMGIDMNQ